MPKPLMLDYTPMLCPHEWRCCVVQCLQFKHARAGDPGGRGGVGASGLGSVGVAFSKGAAARDKCLMVAIARVAGAAGSGTSGCSTGGGGRGGRFLMVRP